MFYAKSGQGAALVQHLPLSCLGFTSLQALFRHSALPVTKNVVPLKQWATQAAVYMLFQVGQDGQPSRREGRSYKVVDGS